MNVLDVENLDVFLGESHILHHVSFAVPDGAATALLGRNGAGKTTTLRGVLGLTDRRGSVRLDGAEISGLRTHRIVRRGIGYVPEDRDVFAGLTVAENLRIAEHPGQHPDYDRVYALFPRLAERAHQRAGTLSGGEQQMLALGRVLLGDSRLLLVDEPTKGLAPALVTEVATAMQRIAERQTTLLVEQNLEVVRAVARHVVVLDQGAMVHTGPADELFADPDRVRALLGVGTAGVAR